MLVFCYFSIFFKFHFIFPSVCIRQRSCVCVLLLLCYCVVNIKNMYCLIAYSNSNKNETHALSLAHSLHLLWSSCTLTIRYILQYKKIVLKIIFKIQWVYEIYLSVYILAYACIISMVCVRHLI